MSDVSAPQPPTDEELEHRAALIGILSDEVDRQLESVGARTRSISTRASLLVGAAGIMTGLQVSAVENPLYAASVGCAAIAAILGVVILIPRTAPEVSVMATDTSAETELWNCGSVRSRWTLAHWKHTTLLEQERALRWRATLVTIGFGMIALAIIFAAAALISTVGDTYVRHSSPGRASVASTTAAGALTYHS